MIYYYSLLRSRASQMLVVLHKIIIFFLLRGTKSLILRPTFDSLMLWTPIIYSKDRVLVI